MKYVSIDIETTGLDPDSCQVLEIGAVCDDTDKLLTEAPQWSTLVMPRNMFVAGELIGIVMNAELLKELMHAQKVGLGYETTLSAIPALTTFIQQHCTGKITIAGKNFANFDLQFLSRMPGWAGIKHSHRFLDPGSMFVNSRDNVMPDTAECLRRIGAAPLVKHRALDDAYDVCRLIRAKLGTP